MYSLIEDYLFLWQIVLVKKKFSNKELNLLRYFLEITNITPVDIILRNHFIFFLVNNEDYFQAKQFITKLRSKLQKKKILIIRDETTLSRLLFSFFQDTYIHDIILNNDYVSNKKFIKILFLIEKDRAIAIGNEGDYIKTINFMFDKCINFKNFNDGYIKIPLEIKCELTGL